MGFRLIDLETWHRKEYYLHYMNQVVCTYSMTVDIDVTPLLEMKLYPAMLWLLTDTVNRYEEFRTHQVEEGVGIFDSMCPSYTIFNKESKKFSVIWTEFDSDYSAFLQRYESDCRRYGACESMFPKDYKPDHAFDVSMLPWQSFSSFNLNIYGEGKWLLPIFTMGKTYVKDGRTLMPLAIQVHHAVCDGYHVCKFVETLQEKIMQFPEQDIG